MFDPNQLIYLGRRQGLDVFEYGGVRIDAAITADRGSRTLCLGFCGSLPESVMPGLMAWFGLDWRRDYAEYQYPDNSHCFIQKIAA